MVQLGKNLKGKAPVKPQKKTDIIRIRAQDDQVEKADAEMALMKMRKENLRQ